MICKRPTKPLGVFLVLGLLVSCVDADVVGYWQFDEGTGEIAKDGSGNGNDGTLENGTEWTGGKFGDAVQFDGTNGYVNLGNADSFSITGDFTFSMWVKISEYPTSWRNMLSKLVDDTHAEFNFRYKDSTQGQFYYGTGSAAIICMWNPSEDLPLDTWTHIAGVRKNKAYLKLYFNGVEKRTSDITTDAVSTDANVTIGRQSNAIFYFSGIMDEVAIFTEALGEAEIQSVMSGLGHKELASKPNPANEASDRPRDTPLSWAPGTYAATHNVYFGTTWEDVNNASLDNPLDVLVSEDQDANAFDLDKLALSQTYFWRIDEVNAPPDRTVFKGDVWSFTVEPVSYAIPMDAVSVTVSSSDPTSDPNNIINGVGLDENDQHSNDQEHMWLADSTDTAPSLQFELSQVEKLDKVHVWNHNTQTEAILGFGLKEALIEYSAGGETWSELGTVELPQATGANDYTGIDVPLEGIVAGHVKITGLSNHSMLGLPQMGLSEVRFYAVPMRARREIPATGSINLDPLIGLSWRAGRGAAQHEVLLGTDPNALALVATVEDVAYTATVDLDSTIYWQVNEVNDAMDPAIWEGQLWSMDTTEYLPVDDMESYKSLEGSFVWETWTDGFGDDTNGALLGHNGDDMETDITHDGSQSLPYYYGQGGAANSEASRDIERDWGQHGIVSLSLMFYGAESNVAGELYIKVNDTEIATYPVSSDLMIPQWQAWTMDLPAAALGSVHSLTIGVKGGTGMILIDAIRLYNKTSETVAGVTPDDTDLVAHYPFEGNASDVSGNGNDGTLEGGPQFVTGKVGDALDFDGVDDFVSTGKVASQLGIDGNKPRTVSAWVYTRGYANGGIFDVGARVTGEDFCLRTLSDIVDRWRIQYWGGDFDFTFNTMERWVHFTHVHDGTHTKIYADGRLIVDWEKTINTTDINPFQIGCYGWQNDFFYGVIDEVRVYSRPLSQEEALGLAGRTDPIFKEF